MTDPERDKKHPESLTELVERYCREVLGARFVFIDLKPEALERTEVCPFDNACPWCLTPNNGISGLTPGSFPKDGDVTICWSCRNTAVFHGDSLKLHKPTPAEQEAIDANPEVRQAMKAATESYDPLQAVALQRRMHAAGGGP